MKTTFKQLALLWILTVSLLACSGDGEDDEQTNMRFINAVSDVKLVNFIVDFDIFFQNVSYLTNSGYFDIDTDPHIFQVTPSNALTTLAETKTTLSDSQDYTYIAYGSSINTDGLLLRDDNEPAGDESFKARMINVAESARSIDVYVVSNASSAGKVAPTEDNFGYRSVSHYSVGRSGTYFIVATNSKSGETLGRTGPIQFENENVYSILFSDAKSGSLPVQIVVLHDSNG